MTLRLTRPAPSVGGARDSSAVRAGREPSDRPPLRLPQALLAAAAGGLVTALAFPEPGWWPLVLPGAALQLLALIGRGVRGALLAGFVAGLTFFGSLIDWTSLFLGPVPYVALTTLMALVHAAGGLLIALAYAWLPRRWPGLSGRLVLLPTAVAGLWTAREALASSWPYGGFAWGRLAQSQSASPFAELVSWLGLSGLSFVIVWLAAFLVESLRRAPREDAAALGGWSSALLGAATALAALAAVPAFALSATGSIRIAAVQGGTPEAGYFMSGERGDVVRGHLEASALIPADAQPDLILWPEGSVDVSPLYDAGIALALTALSEQHQAPVIANTVTVERGASEAEDRYFNTQFVWDAEEGLVDQVSKQHPIPFGEYIPDRDFWYALAPDLIGLVQRGYTPGEGPALLEANGTGLATFICYDIVDDEVIRQAVLAGGEVLLAPTNNADFGQTDELAQQLAFARLRAVETGRAIVQVSTVGYSAVYGPDGSELASLPWYEAGVMVVDVPTISGITPAVAFGRHVELLAAGAGVVLLAGARLGTTGRPASRA